MNLVLFLIAGVNESEFSFSSSENNPPSIIIYSSIDRMQRFIIAGNSISSIHCSNQSVAWIWISEAYLNCRLGNRLLIKNV